MCGIAGKLNWETFSSAGTVLKMCEKMIHRGPDDSGIVTLENITLGHRRLSIIDLSDNAKQPMVSRDGRYHIVYNGEVYNFKDIRKELKSLNVSFKSNSDTEVVLYSYIQWGKECLNRFNGMFAFAIWDNHLKELFLARDRFGKKPLYYHINNRKELTFASELTALIADNSIPRRISFEALNCYLAIGYILSPMTLYKDVYKLEPASYMLVSNEGEKITKHKYWDYAKVFYPKTGEDESTIAEHLKFLLEESVKRRMVSDVPIGAFLSGGVDSSSIVSLMKKYHKGDLHTFSVGFRQESYNEMTDAERTAKWIGTIHHNHICEVNDGMDILNNALDSFDELFADNSLIPTYEVSRLASQYVTVVLSGDGADELFAGYVTYKADKYYNYVRFVPQFLKKAFIKLGVNYANFQKKLNWGYKTKQFFYGALHSPEQAHYLWRVFFHPEERIGILGEQYKELIYDTDPFHIFKKYYDVVADLKALDRNLYVDGMTWLPDDILVKVDRVSMQSSIEVRCPYLDVELLSYAASIPVELKMKGLKTKYILKKALKDVLPGFVLSKKKSGFNAPIGAWIDTKGLDEFCAFNRYVFRRKLDLQLNSNE